MLDHACRSSRHEAAAPLTPARKVRRFNPHSTALSVALSPIMSRMNDAGHPSTHVAAHPGNRNRELHGAYSARRELDPRAAEIARRCSRRHRTPSHSIASALRRSAPSSSCSIASTPRSRTAGWRTTRARRALSDRPPQPSLRPARALAAGVRADPRGPGRVGRSTGRGRAGLADQAPAGGGGGRGAVKREQRRAVLENIIAFDDPKVTPADRLNALEQLRRSKMRSGRRSCASRPSSSRGDRRSARRARQEPSPRT
jgi:hypothetical protein